LVGDVNVVDGAGGTGVSSAFKITFFGTENSPLWVACRG
jgi:hypothetical protein